MAAYSEALTVAVICDKCHNYHTSFSGVEQDVFFEALNNAEPVVRLQLLAFVVFWLFLRKTLPLPTCTVHLSAVLIVILGTCMGHSCTANITYLMHENMPGAAPALHASAFCALQLETYFIDDGTHLILKVLDYKDQVKRAVAAAFAEALAGAAAIHEGNGCVAWVEEPPCTLGGQYCPGDCYPQDAGDDVKRIDFIAEAGAALLQVHALFIHFHSSRYKAAG